MQNVLKEEYGERCSSYRMTVKRSSEEMKNSMKSCMSDPIGLEFDLSSGGPLDEGVYENNHEEHHGIHSFQNWKYSNQHLRIKTTPTFKICGDQQDLHPAAHSSHVQNTTMLSSPSARSNSSDQIPSSIINIESDQKLQSENENYSGSLNNHLQNSGKGGRVSIEYNDSSEKNCQNPKLLQDLDIVDNPVIKNVFAQVSEHSTTDEKIDMFLVRRTIRSHTSQGIPAHKIRALLNQQYGEGNDNHSSSEQNSDEVRSLKEELNFYKELSLSLEEQVKLLNSLLIEERKKADQPLVGLPTPPLSVSISASPQAWSQNMSSWQPLQELSPITNTTVPTPQSISASPDPFSPFDQISPESQQVLSPESGICDPCMVPRHVTEPYPPSSFPSENAPESYQNEVVGCPNEDVSLDLTKNFSPASNGMVHEYQQSYLNGLKVNLIGTEKEALSYYGHFNGEGKVETMFDALARFDGLPYSHFAPNLHGPLPLTLPFGSPFLTGFPCQAQQDLSGAHSDRYGRNGIDSHAPPDLLIARALGPRSQEASIQLQQQLKNGHQSRKTAIIHRIAPHLIKLAEDKHGNFLVQRAINVEPKLAWRLQGHFVSLSLSQFGCHVVQKLLDDEDEEIRKLVVDELLKDENNDTLKSRNSIHIWQKVLEVTWKESDMRSKIIRSLNDRMKGNWAEMAKMESGSIICQNLFESGNHEEKQSCLDEILERFCECAYNQWGVWVVQHIIEHGEIENKRKAFDELLKEAYQLTLSQYGQKAIMSALKAKDSEFIRSYINILCERDASQVHQEKDINCKSTKVNSNRRSVLVDIATSSQGVQIMTQLLTSVTNEQRERIIKTVRKNSVFLKGSKAGLRVHQLCERARAFTGY